MRLGAIIRDAFAILPRHGMALYVEFFLAGVAASSLAVLLAPQATRDRLSGLGGPVDLDGLLSLIFLDPLTYITSAIYTFVSATAFLRIWWSEEGDAPDPAERRAVYAANIVPLVVLQIAADLATGVALYLFLLPAALVAALVTFVVPATVLEGAGWAGLKRSFGLAVPHILPLSAIWLMILVPWILFTIISDPTSLDYQDAPAMTLWLTLIISDLYSPALSALGVLFVVASYRQVVDRFSDRDLDDTFR